MDDRKTTMGEFDGVIYNAAEHDEFCDRLWKEHIEHNKKHNPEYKRNGKIKNKEIESSENDLVSLEIK